MRPALSIFNFKEGVSLFLLKGVLLFLLLLASCTVANIAVDYYGVFREVSPAPRMEPNQRIAKIRHLLHHLNDYDGVLFGSSRSAKIAVSLVPGQRIYNLSASLQTPGEYMRDLNFLLERGMNIKHVYISLDEFSYRIEPSFYIRDRLRGPYPVSWREWLAFIRMYLIVQPMLAENLLGTLPRDSVASFGIATDGVVRVPTEKDAWIEAHPQEHAELDVFKHSTPIAGDYADGTLNALLEIQKTCRKRQIDCVFFFNPAHPTTLLGNDYGGDIQFKMRLAEHLPFWDFSCFNSIVLNNYYWYETSHTRPMVGRMILSRITGFPLESTPGDFGVRITRASVTGLRIPERNLTPERAVSHFDLGTDFLINGNIDRAIFQFKKALELVPDFPNALVNLAEALHRKGDISAALQLYEAALAKNKEIAEAHAGIGRILLATDHQQEALQQFIYAASYESGGKTESHYDLARLLQRYGNLAAAQKVLSDITRIDPFDDLAYVSLGAVRLAQHDRTAAVQAFRGALALNPGNDEALQALRGLDASH